MTRFIRYLPVVIAFLAGVALVIVGHASHGDVSNDWLAFAGSLLGSAIAALTGFWLILLQEQRAAATRRDQLLEALAYLDNAVTAMIDFGKEGRRQGEAAAGVNAVAVAAKVFEHVRNAFGITDIRTVLPLESLAAALQAANLAQLEASTRAMRDDHLSQYFRLRPEGASLFEVQAESIRLNIEDVRRTLR